MLEETSPRHSSKWVPHSTFSRHGKTSFLKSADKADTGARHEEDIAQPGSREPKQA